MGKEVLRNVFFVNRNFLKSFGNQGGTAEDFRPLHRDMQGTFFLSKFIKTGGQCEKTINQ